MKAREILALKLMTLLIRWIGGKTLPTDIQVALTQIADTAEFNDEK